MPTVTGRENFARAIEFRSPAYLPCTLRVNLSWLHDRSPSQLERIRELSARFPDDMLPWLNAARNHSEPVTAGRVTRWVDEWLTGWEDDGHGAKTESNPLESGYDALAGYTFPDPALPGRFADIDRWLAARGGRYTQGVVWFTLFERLWMLRGFTNMLTDPYDHPAAFAALRDRVTEFNLAMIDQWVARGIDGVFFSDDWGSQRGLLINPDDWRRFYKPSYRRMFERVRAGGAHVWMHLCGDISAILPDLVEIGLQVLNPVQPQAMDVRRLAREFGGRLCFNGGVDVQGTLIRGTPDDVRREVDELVRLFGGYQGGYIADTSHSVMPETPLANIIALLEALLAYQ